MSGCLLLLTLLISLPDVLDGFSPVAAIYKPLASALTDFDHLRSSPLKLTFAKEGLAGPVSAGTEAMLPVTEG